MPHRVEPFASDGGRLRAAAGWGPDGGSGSGVVRAVPRARDSRMAAPRRAR